MKRLVFILICTSLLTLSCGLQEEKKRAENKAGVGSYGQ
jgi:hypothetical protein